MLNKGSNRLGGAHVFCYMYYSRGVKYMICGPELDHQGFQSGPQDKLLKSNSNVTITNITGVLYIVSDHIPNMSCLLNL